MSNDVIIFEGDYIRDTDGAVSKVIDIRNWDDNGDADVFLENGRTLNSKDITLENVLLESEVII
jgi:hypothetical protein